MGIDSSIFPSSKPLGNSSHIPAESGEFSSEDKDRRYLGWSTVVNGDTTLKITQRLSWPCQTEWWNAEMLSFLSPSGSLSRSRPRQERWHYSGAFHQSRRKDLKLLTWETAWVECWKSKPSLFLSSEFLTSRLPIPTILIIAKDCQTFRNFQRQKRVTKQSEKSNFEETDYPESREGQKTTVSLEG